MTHIGSQLDASGSQAGGRTVLKDLASLSSASSWYVVNDNVMGGRSQGAFEMEQGALRFAGRTNTNGGGFSSIRTQPMLLDSNQGRWPTLYLATHDCCALAWQAGQLLGRFRHS